jgi:hypothetical protein
VRRVVPDLPSRPRLLALAALGLALAAALGPVMACLDAARDIDAARARLDAARGAAARPPATQPPVAPGADALAAAFRSRLDALAAERSVLIDRAVLDADPARPDLPRLRADLRGTAEGLHGLMHALETGAPLLAAEEADLTVERAADSEIGRPTILRLALTLRGVILRADAAPGSGAGAPLQRTMP